MNRLEILRTDQYDEFEEFVQNHPAGTITQSIPWHQVKDNWHPEVVVVRNDTGDIIAGVSILVRKVPVFGVSLMYAPRGPVGDYGDTAQLEELQKGIDALAKKHRAYMFKVDPDVLVSDTEFLQRMINIGYEQELGEGAFANIQARFNYRLSIEGMSLDDILMSFHSKTRYNVRLAGRRGVEVKSLGKDGLDDFYHLMEITGKRDDFTIRSKEYFANMLDALGENVRLYIAYYEGEAISGSIATNYNGKTYYLYGCSSNEHRNTMSTYLLQWEMIRWAQETGCTVYDMQGVSANYEDEDDPLYGLFRFKDGFNGQVDELIGELNYTYKPFMAKVVDKGIAANEWLREMRRKRG